MRANTFANMFPFIIAAGAELALPVNCDFVYVSELSGGSLDLETGQGRVPLIVGRRIEFAEQEIGTIRIRNKGTTEATGELLVGSGDVRDSSVVGKVSVLNLPATSIAATDSGNQYIVSGNSVGAAGEYPAIQLWNPAGSGVNIYVNHLSVNAVSAGLALILKKYNIALSTVYHAAINKMDSTISPTSKTYVQSMVSTTIGSTYGQISLDQSGIYDFLKSSPIKISEGEGLLVLSTTVASTIKANFDFEEVAA